MLMRLALAALLLAFAFPGLLHRIPSGLRRRGICFASTALVGGLVVTSGGNALAYSGTNAAHWADANRNTTAHEMMAFGDGNFNGDDCTNFISNALHVGGGYAYTGAAPTSGYGNYTSTTTQWWEGVEYTPRFNVPHNGWTTSWSVAGDQFGFQRWKNPGGTVEGSAHGAALGNPYTPNSVVTGDLLFYDWDGNGTIDHVGMQVGVGSDPTAGANFYGNVMDQHSHYQYHAGWNLSHYGANVATETVTFMHIWSSN